MANTTDQFFEQLAAEPQPLLAHSKGTLRFDVLTDGEVDEHWCVTMDHGTVHVAREELDADAVVRLDRKLFDDVVAGRANAMAAVLRGEVGVTGNPDMLMRFERTFPGPHEGQEAQ